MRIAKSPAAIVAALVMFASTFLVALTASPASAATHRFTSITANIGSGADNDLNDNGTFDGWGTNENPLVELTAQINANQPDVVFIQEACERDYAKMQQKFPGYYFGQFVWQQQGSRPDLGAVPPYTQNSCEKTNGQQTVEQKGTFIMSAWPIVDQSVQVLPVIPVAGTADATFQTRKSRRHTLAGAQILWGAGGGKGIVNVFNTHLPAGDEDADDISSRTMATTAVANTVNAYDAGGKVVLGGDFNSSPKTYNIDLLHRVKRDGSGAASGLFWETGMKQNIDGTACKSAFDNVCRDGEKTLRKSGRKSDYIFYGKTYVKAKLSVGATSNRSETSAHNVLVGTVDLIDFK
ncbi:endonuclease/exonuclease/phosphatase family protein [Nocardioides sp. STR2]|uniref:Endonuclease/exonuclease/phosphatase family protein n=1 Tax=Nocardioides pini TaxID=2975053 RepID=A0ABT4CFQ7_9ACTN|nr:endonuclease/exonuclease/phosphatase family protein [Nocardioides pini]MCY4726687.1 endonuclease/exonuclease/phosphatase family protein [Nocardioides pini]